MAKKKINVDELTAAVSSYEKSLNALKDEIPKLKLFLAKLENDWDSDASRSYASKVRQQIKSLEDAYRVIKELRDFSKGVIKTFELADSTLRLFSVPGQIAQNNANSGGGGGKRF